MRVTIELQAYLEQYSPNGQSVFEQELPDGATVSRLLNSLDIPVELASVIVVGDIDAPFDHVLRDGDRVTLIPPLAGG